MAGQWLFVVTGLEGLVDIQTASEQVKRKAAQAINKTVRDYRSRGEKLILQEIEFPKGYLSPAGGRLAIGRKASASNPEGSIKAKSKPTSLARFVSGGGGRGQGTDVRVTPGKSKTMKRAFLIPLKGGSGVETKNNMGLAIRLRPGETLSNKKTARKLDSNLYLLYGPSVDQVFLHSNGQKGVAAEMAPDIQRDVAEEFIRLMDL